MIGTRIGPYEVIAKLGGVGQISVMRNGNLAAGAVHRQRLRVAQVRGTGRRVARVAYGHVAL